MSVAVKEQATCQDQGGHRHGFWNNRGRLSEKSHFVETIEPIVVYEETLRVDSDESGIDILAVKVNHGMLPSSGQTSQRCGLVAAPNTRTW
jgi:hypothetical protein